MQKEVYDEILHDLGGVIKILEQPEQSDVEELKKLSDHAVEVVALYKDLDVISMTVLIYSLYKIVATLKETDYKTLHQLLTTARQNLEQRNLGKYNSLIKKAYQVIRKANSEVREHLQDVMDAARIKKGSSLVQRGLSIGQAAGLMGLSNWDLQQYTGRTTSINGHHEAVPAVQRMKKAAVLFGL